jgi:predicted  nucleic acid-binding Zn-ribbon protein
MGSVIRIIDDIADDVGDVVGDVIDVVDDAVDWVGDAISDVADFAYDEILQPVGNFVEGYVQGMLDDPIVTAAKIAAIATGNAWAIPLIDGAAVAIEGGDFEDVLTTVAISYATQTIGAEFGDIAGEFVGDAVGEAVSSEVAKEVVAQTVKSGTESAFSALLYGTDPLEAFATGGLNAAINATSAKVAEGVGFDFKTPQKDANGNIIKDSSGNTVYRTNTIPNVAMKIVNAGVTAALTGKEITPELITGAVAEGVLTMDLVRSTGAELGIDFSKDSPELMYLTAGLQKVATIAATGGNGEQAAAAFKATLDAYGAKALSDVVKNSQIGDYISDTIDMMSGDYQKATGLVETINAEAQKRSGYLSEYEDKRTELNGLLDDINARKAEIANLPTGTAAEQATYNSKVAELNSAVSNFNSKFASYNPRMENLKTSISQSNTKLETLQTQLTSAQQDLQRGMDRLDDKIAPFTNGLIKATVEVMDPDFKETEYRRINRLDADTNVFEHFLANSSNENMYTNYEQYDAAVARNTDKIVQQALSDAGIDPSTIDKNTLDKLYTDISNGLNRFVDAGAYALDDTGQMMLFTNMAYEVLANTQDNAYTNATLTSDLRIKLEDLGFDMSEVANGAALNDAEKAALISQDRISSGKNTNTAVLDDGVSWEDVAKYGGETVITNRDGQRIWTLPKDTGYIKRTSRWTAAYGRITTEASYDQHGNFLSSQDFYSNGTTVPGSLNIAVSTSSVSDQDKISALTNIKQEGLDVASAADNFGYESHVAQTIGNAIDRFIQTNQDDALIAISRNLNNAKNTANKILRDASEDVVSDLSGISNLAASTDNETLKKSLYITLNGVGQFLQAINGVTILANESPKGTILGDFAQSLMDMTKPLTSAEYKQGVKDYKTALSGYGSTYQEAYDAAKKRGASEEAAKAAGLKAYNNLSWVERRVDDTLNFFDAAAKYPEQALIETLAIEGISEVAPLFATAGTYSAARLVLKNAAEATAKRMSRNAALAAGQTVDIVEAYGGAADQAFTEAYKLAINSGYSERESLDYGLYIGAGAGTVNSLWAAIGMNVGGMALEKTYLNKVNPSGVLAGRLDKFKEAIKDGTSVFFKEGLTEANEEKQTAQWYKSRLAYLDPTIDVERESFNAALMGFALGGTIGGSMTVGMHASTGLANTLMTLNPEVRSMVENTPDTPEDVAAAQTILANAGITGADQIDILNNISDGSFIGTGEAFSYFYNANPNYNPSDDEFYSFVGAANDNNTPEAISNYVDTRSTTAQEVVNRAAAEGYTLSIEDAQEFVGQGGANFEVNTLGNVALKYDPLATTRAEVEQRYQELGFRPDNSQVTQFIQEGNEADILDTIAPYIDPRQTTEAEARQYFADQNFVPTNEQVQQFVGQGGADFQSTTGTNIASYVDPRQTTEAEVRQYFADRNFVPTNEQVQQFIGQGGANFQTDTGSNIVNYVNPRQFTEAEARQYFADIGFEPTNEQVQQFVGQGDNNFQGNARRDLAAYVNPRQVTEAEARKYFADLGFTPNNRQLQDFIGQGDENFQANTITSVGEFVDPRQLSEQEVRDLYAKYNYSPSYEEITRFVGQGEEGYEETAAIDVSGYIDANQVTNEEARQFFADLGYEANDAEIASFVAQVEQTTQAENIAKYVDPRQVTMEELQTIADAEGLTLTQALAEAYIGQGGADFQAKQLAAARKEYDPLATTIDEAAEFFAATNYTATPEEMAAFVASKTEETQRSAISAYVNPRQVTEAEATQFFADLGYAADPEEIAQFVGQLNDDTYQQTQFTNLGAYVDPRMVDSTEVRDFISNLGIDITNAREEDINKLVGQYDESLLAGRVQEALPTITTNMLTDELTAIQNLLGKPGQQVTQADLDFLTSSIASNIVLNEQQTAQYDVNADGVVDAADQALLEQAFTGTPTSFAETSVYSPTGMYRTLQQQQIQAANDQQALMDQAAADQQAALQAQQDLQSNFEQQLEQQQQMTQDLVTQTAIDTQTAIQQQAEAQRNRSAFGQLLAAPGYSITADQVDPAKIDYIYDFSSIFANPQQVALYGSPFGYREGGQIDATTDKLLRIIGGS